MRNIELGDYVKVTLLKSKETRLGRVTNLNSKRGIGILCHGAGSLDLPSENATKIKPFPFENPYSSDYFDEQGNLLPEVERMEIENIRQQQYQSLLDSRSSFKEFAKCEPFTGIVEEGDSVKVGLISVLGGTEWIWVLITEVLEGSFKGTLDNTPVVVSHNLNDTLEFTRENIRNKYKEQPNENNI